jgi:hypothetical protein
MRFVIAVAAAALNSSALAQVPAGLTKIYDAPTQVNLAGRPVLTDIILAADMNAAKAGDLKLALVTDVTDEIAQTKADLKSWIAGRYDECGERWRAGEPYIGFPKGAIRFRLALELEYWTCGWNGQGEPGRLTHDEGAVDVTLIPYVEGGRLQARLGDFSMVVTTGVSKYLPLEFVVRRALEGELKKLNENPKFHRAPQPFFGEKFAYESIAAAVDAQKRVVITARYGAKGKAAAFDRIVAKMRSEGITQ